MRPGGVREHRGVGDGIPTGRVDSPLAWAGGLEPAPDGAGGVRAVPRGSRGARTGWQRARRAAPLRGTAPGPPLRPSDGAGSAAGVRAGFRGAAAAPARRVRLLYSNLARSRRRRGAAGRGGVLVWVFFSLSCVLINLISRLRRVKGADPRIMGAVSGWARKMSVKEEREKGPHNGAFLPRPCGGALSHGPRRGPRPGGLGGRGWGRRDGGNRLAEPLDAARRSRPPCAGAAPRPPGALPPPEGSPDGRLAPAPPLAAQRPPPAGPARARPPGGSRSRRWGRLGGSPGWGGAERRHLGPPSRRSSRRSRGRQTAPGRSRGLGLGGAAPCPGLRGEAVARLRFPSGSPAPSRGPAAGEVVSQGSGITRGYGPRRCPWRGGRSRSSDHTKLESLKKYLLIC